MTALPMGVPEQAPSRRSAVVTGSSRGIGAAIALRLAADGFGVVVNCRSDSHAAEDIVRRIHAAGGVAHSVQGDITDPGCAGRLVDAAEQHFGGLDVWVNNAGAFHQARLADTSDHDLEQVFSINTFAAFRALREAAGRIRDGGRIVLVSSALTALHRPGSALFSASKAAAEQFARVLAHELGPRGVTVNSVLAGPVRTERSVLPATAVAEIVARTPLGRRGQPEDIAQVVAFLASSAGGWVTAQRVGASGGLL